ncbi:PREDICTED: transcription factor 24-like, partial [Phaethon lepturus]|uniref:transcription factor 24-like n=1 Tax=Phaethon lepturus TaxID=97097 RepID=UPI000530B101
AQDFIRCRCEAFKPETLNSRGAQGNEVFRYVRFYLGCHRNSLSQQVKAGIGLRDTWKGCLPKDGGISNSCRPPVAGQRAGAPPGRPAAANAARERSRVQTLRHAFLELQKTLPSVPPDTKLSKLDVLLLATTYIAHLTRSLQDEEEAPGEGLGTLRGDGYLHPVKKWPMRSRLYIGATGQFLTHSAQGDGTNQGETSTASQI